MREGMMGEGGREGWEMEGGREEEGGNMSTHDSYRTQGKN